MKSGSNKTTTATPAGAGGKENAAESPRPGLPFGPTRQTLVDPATRRMLPPFDNGTDLLLGAIDPIEDDVRTVSKSDNNSTHQEQYREFSTALEELINAVVAQPAQANSVLDFLVKLTEMARSNETYEKVSFEEVLPELSPGTLCKPHRCANPARQYFCAGYT